MLRKMGSSNKIPSNNTQIPNKLQVPIAKFQKNPRIGICHLEFPCDLILGNWNFSLNFLDVRNMSYSSISSPPSPEVVNRDARQCDEKADACLRGVLIERVQHDEHARGDE